MKVLCAALMHAGKTFMKRSKFGNSAYIYVEGFNCRIVSFSRYAFKKPSLPNVSIDTISGMLVVLTISLTHG